MRKNKQMAQSRSFRRCQIKPLAERLELRAMLCVDLHGGEEMEHSLVDGDHTSSFTVESCQMPQPSANQMSFTTSQFAPPQLPLADTFKLHSLPTATKRIYLDFDGHFTTNTIWQNYFRYSDINTPAFSLDSNYTSFSDTEKGAIQDIWARVVEDFLPFQVDVTTEDPGIDGLLNTGGGDNSWGIRVVVGGDGAWAGSAGIAVMGGFGQSDGSPAFAFADQWWKTNPNIVTQCISHEVGHTLGLSHDGSGYYGGHGSGATSWVPIMGSGDKSLSQWSKGEYNGANNKEDDLSIITTTAKNGFGYRADDHGNTTGAATAVSGTAANGIVERNTDVDVFSFASSGTVKVKISPAAVGANLDILAEILDSNGTVLQTSNPIGALDASFNFTATAGTYYLRVQGTGEGNPLSTGYTNYASLGHYTASFEGSSTPPPTLVIAATSADKAEGTAAGTTPFTFTVTRAGDLAAASSVFWAVTGSGASQASAADFVESVLPSGTVSFAANESTKTITVYVSADATVESDEGFTVTLSTPTGATLGTPASATGTIRNDDLPPPSIAIAAASADKAEGTGAGTTPFTFTATRSGDLSGASSVSWAVTGSGGSQASAADFAGSQLLSGTVLFAANESTKTITVNVSADATVESDEGFTVNLFSPMGASLGSPASASGTIRNDDLPPPSFSIAAASAEKAEGTGGGTTPFTFTVTRGGDLAAASSVSWAVTGSGGNQAGAADFAGSVLPSGSASFAANESTKTITVNVVADASIESDEGFTVTLSNPSGATLGTPASATGTIRNDDFPPAPTVAIAAASAEKAEGTGGGATSFTFAVTRSGDLTVTSSVSWAVTGSGGNQAGAADFAGSVLPSGSVSFAAGESTKTITVSVSADSTVEADESFTITISAPNGATLGTPAFASGIIRNDDLPVLSIGDARITETDSGTVNAVLVVTLSGPAFVPVTVSYATFDRTATTAGSDYFNTTGTITFAPGETSKPITVSVQGDTKFESEETFGVRLSAANGGTIAKPEGLVTILNDDTRSRIAIAATDARRSEGNTGRMAFTFTVTRTGSLVGDVMLPWKVSGSGARPADRFDFIGGVLPTGTVWFAPGRQTATVTVNVLADRVAEFDEQFTVTLLDPKNGLDFLAVGGGSANGTILNDDGGVPRTLVSATIQAQAFAGSGVATMPSSKTITPQAFAAAGYSTVPATGVSAKKAQFPAMPRF